jgi:cytochrome c oxidase cbb3-type subunit 3
MSPTDRDRLLAHDYDGIEEYDNPLPSWWSWLFVATIVFSVGYYLYYQIGPGPSLIAHYEQEMREYAQQQAKLAPPAGAAGVSEVTLRALMKDAKAMAAGKEMFAVRCVPCHGPQGQGIIGPNLTDDYWLHGRTLLDIRRTIHDGIPDKGMIPWKDQLRPAEIDAMTAYVATLYGTKPPNPKPPQGVNGKGEAAPEAPTAAK